MTLLYIFAGLVVALLAVLGITYLRVASLRRTGAYPAPGQATMSDVERLARSGQKVWAIRCYREIHGCGLAEAKKAIDDLQVAT